MNVTKGELVVALIALSATTFVIGRATAADPTMTGFEIMQPQVAKLNAARK